MRKQAKANIADTQEATFDFNGLRGLAAPTYGSTPDPGTRGA
ncbi:MAG: hypothetical protein U0800_03315 [Isosphaeraceae bacterium]